MLSPQRPYPLVHLYTATLAVASSPYLLSCEDKKRRGCATQQRRTIVLKTTNWPVTSLKMDGGPAGIRG